MPICVRGSRSGPTGPRSSMTPVTAPGPRSASTPRARRSARAAARSRPSRSRARTPSSPRRPPPPRRRSTHPPNATSVVRVVGPPEDLVVGLDPAAARQDSSSCRGRSRRPRAAARRRSRRRRRRAALVALGIARDQRRAADRDGVLDRERQAGQRPGRAARAVVGAVSPAIATNALSASRVPVHRRDVGLDDLDRRDLARGDRRERVRWPACGRAPQADRTGPRSARRAAPCPRRGRRSRGR